MPLESCMILLDNSQYMLNGDYTPTRLSAQIDAANLVLSSKTQSNPESTVGVIAMSGGIYSHPESVELLVSPTEDMGKILSALHGIPVRGKGVVEDLGKKNATGVDIAASVQVASLALKHRKNKNGQQRIVIFVGSPLTSVPNKELVKAGKGLKKNNVAIDVVAIGELEENEEKLNQLVDAANGSGGGDGERTCHLVTIPSGVLPSDVLVGSPVIHGGSGGGDYGGGAGAGVAAGGGAGGGADAFAEYGGIDPNMDPELAMVLRVSMEEERARLERIAQEQAAAAAEGGDTAAAGGEEEKQGESNEADTGMEVEGSSGEEATSAPSAPFAETAPPAMMGDDMGDEDELLQQALAMSMAETQPDSGPTADSTTQHADQDDDAAMQLALQMSLQADQGEDSPPPPPEGQQQQFQDPQFVNQLLGSLPGVNPDDPAIRSAIENLNQSSNEEEKDGEGKEETKDDSDKKD